MRLTTYNPEMARKGINKIIKLYDEKKPTFWKDLIGEQMSSNEAFIRLKAMADFGDAPVVPENTDVPVSDLQFPFEGDFYMAARGLGYSVSGRAAFTDIYSVIKRPTENLLKSMRDAEEKGAANMLTLGHTAPSAGGTWTLDGVALFSASHPVNTGSLSNTGALALDTANLETATQIAMQSETYMGKVWVGPSRFKLVVPTSLNMLARRLGLSELYPGTDANDKNVVADNIRVVRNPYLTFTQRWYLLPDDDTNPLFRVNGRPLQFKDEEIQRRFGDRYIAFHQEYGYGAMDFRGCWGSNVA